MTTSLRLWLQTRWARDEQGASLVEYGLLLALVALVAIVAVQTFGEGVSTQFSKIASQTEAA